VAERLSVAEAEDEVEPLAAVLALPERLKEAVPLRVVVTLDEVDADAEPLLLALSEALRLAVADCVNDDVAVGTALALREPLKLAVPLNEDDKLPLPDIESVALPVALAVAERLPVTDAVDEDDAVAAALLLPETLKDALELCDEDALREPENEIEALFVSVIDAVRLSVMVAVVEGELVAAALKLREAVALALPLCVKESDGVLLADSDPLIVGLRVVERLPVQDAETEGELVTALLELPVALELRLLVCDRVAEAVAEAEELRLRDGLNEIERLPVPDVESDGVALAEKLLLAVVLPLPLLLVDMVALAEALPEIEEDGALLAVVEPEKLPLLLELLLTDCEADEVRDRLPVPLPL
jgi:hypothetical protein